MCTGVEIALVASSVLAAGGAVASGQQQKKMANYQAAQAEADAEASKAAAKVEAERIRKAGRQQASAANAALAASGVETGEERRCVSRQVLPGMRSRTPTRQSLMA
jgi:hypothetical protein